MGAATVHDLRDALSIADEATRRWRRQRHHDDVAQAARIAAWRTFDRGHRTRPAIYRSAHSAAIDELRRITGRRAGTRAARITTSIDHISYVETPGDDPDPIPPSLQYGLTGRHAVIVDLVAAGELRQDIAAELGVHPSRVTQLLREVRRAIERGDPERENR